jgi:hypothetical protein
MPQIYTSPLLKLLNYLNKKKIMFRLEQQRDDAIMVSFDFVRIRVEVEVFEDHYEFSTFTGDESINSDEAELFKLIDDNCE